MKISKNIISIALATLMLTSSLPMPVFATTIDEGTSISANISSEKVSYSREVTETDNVFYGECGENLEWSLDKATGVLTIFPKKGTKGGFMDDFTYYGDNDPTWFSNKSLVKSIYISAGVSNIGEQAFRSFTKCTKVEFEATKNLKSIGANAFYGCSYLETINKLNETSLSTVGSNAFYACKKITELIFPTDLKTIDDHAFYNCSGLTSVTFGDGSLLEKIGSYAFYSCSKIESLVLPSSLTLIDNSAFYKCTSLKKVTFYKGTSSLKEIGNSAFYSCRALTDFQFPNSLDKIGNSAFTGVAITSIAANKDGTTSKNLESVGNYAFYNCPNLEFVKFFDSDKKTIIGNYAFANCSTLNSVELSQNVESIGEYSFYNDPNLSTVTFSKGIEYIGKYAFASNRNIKAISLPSSLKEIDDYAFENSGTFTKIEFPNSLERVGTRAFAGIPTLEEAVFYSKNTSMGSYAVGYSYVTGDNGKSSWQKNQNITIYGYSVSVAKDYADYFDITFVPFDDPSTEPVETTTSSSENPTQSSGQGTTTSQQSTTYPVQPTTQNSTQYTSGGYIVTEKTTTVTYLIGDVNRDGMVNIKDATLIQNALALFTTLDEIAKLSADVNGSGVVDINDVYDLQAYLAHIGNNSIIGTTGEKEYKEVTTTPIPTTQPTTAKPTTKPTTQPTTQAQTYTITFTNNYGWDSVYCYAFSGNSNNGAWPGTEMTFSYKNTIGKGQDVYTIVIPKKYDTIVINNGNNGSQTANIKTGSTDKKYYISGGANNALTVEEW